MSASYFGRSCTPVLFQHRTKELQATEVTGLAMIELDYICSSLDYYQT